jgi:cysteine desulfurase/selenocysteine lyase
VRVPPEVNLLSEALAVIGPCIRFLFMVDPLPFPEAELNEIRALFPILGEQVKGKPLVYLDNAATTQKPAAVIERVADFYMHGNANIHRGVHALSERATEDYESARGTVARFIGADPREIVFTRGSTEALNLLASCLGQSLLKKGDTVLITEMEHHANIVPWQLLRDRMGIRLEAVRVTAEGRLDMEDFRSKLNDLRPALLSVVHVSNSLGIINPVREMIEAAHAHDIPVILDASQSIPHFDVNVRELDCEWLVFSGHKVFGPSGIGVLYGKYDRLLKMPPYQGGGDMIESVSIEKSIFKDPPERFEAGTPHISGAIALATGIEFMQAMDTERLYQHEAALLQAAETGLAAIPGVRIIGAGPGKVPVVSFVMECAHPHDIASFLDAEGIAIRSGHHCTQPLMTRLGLPGTARASFSFYNSLREVDALLATVRKVQTFFG